MCSGLNCPLKQTCYRYKAMPNVYRQSYFSKPPLLKDGCEYYWDVDIQLKDLFIQIK